MTGNGRSQIQVTFRGHLGSFSLDASFSAPATGVTAIFGPSGCGKTTVARCLAGLHHMPGAFCAIDGDVWQDRSTFRKPHQRPIGYVFQDASLFAHLSVKRNLLYGAPHGMKGRPPGGIDFDEVIELLGLGRLLERSVQNLSGGERQRVAIGRALLSQPKLLLMDEPLSALDRRTRGEILPFLERLHERLSLPIIYISHDMSEIERLADHMILMQHGAVIGAGPLHVLQSDPSLPLATVREAAANIIVPKQFVRNGAGLDGTPIARPGRREIIGKPSTRDVMTADFRDINPNHLAAIVYTPDDDVDTLLADFASARLRAGERIGGVVQRNLKDETGRSNGMHVVDLLTGHAISICQPLGAGAMACKLDPAGLAEASVAVTRALSEDVALIIVNKFSKQEADGRGLRNELAEAILAGGPVLTAVPVKCFDAWKEFTGDLGTTLFCAPHVIDAWWREVSARRAGARAVMLAATVGPSAPIFRSSHPTT
jgi:ABC-type sulfate/molybdate transport systems ATPase subunit